MNTAITINNLYRNFDELEALKGISLTVNKGEMFGFVGPDGAGKTTTIRILCGLLLPKSGDVSLFGYSLSNHKEVIKKNIGYLSQQFSLYGDLTVDENIEFFAEINGVKNYKERRNELLEFTRLTPFRKRTADKLSGGMKQKLALASTLIHHPKIVFLDEPTTGVDPLSRRDFWRILASLQQDGITIFMTTPYLDEAERCNRVAMINNGEILTIDTPQKIKKSIKKKILEIVCSPVRDASKIILNTTEYKPQLFGDRINLLLNEDEDISDKIKYLLEINNIVITGMRITSPSLENIFIHLMEGENNKDNSTSTKNVNNFMI